MRQRARAAVIGLGAMGLAWGLLPAAAGAATVRYEVYWGGFHTAEVALDADGGPTGYHTHLGVATTGLAERLSGLTLQAESWGRPAGTDQLAPSRFSADTQAKDSQSRLAVEYAPASPARIVIDETRRLTPDTDDTPRPPVPPELRVGTLDPLSALVEAGRRAGEAAAGSGPTEFVLAVYDGRQRYDAHVTVQGPETTTVHDRVVSGIAVEVTFTPLAGFRDKARAMWSNARFGALIDPASGLPLHVVSKDFTIATVINAELAQAR